MFELLRVRVSDFGGAIWQKIASAAQNDTSAAACAVGAKYGMIGLLNHG